MKQIDSVVVYVSFSFGSMAYVGVPIYDGMSFEECLKLRSEAIDGYVKDGKFIYI